MYSVWYYREEHGDAFVFVSDIPSASLAAKIADALMDEMSSCVYEAWVEKD